MGFSLKGVLGTVAPWIATAIGGPLAGQAVRSISGALGLKDDAKEEDIQAALEEGKLTGEQLVALKKADQDFQQQMEAAGFKHIEELEGLAQKDRDSARAREIAVRDNTPKLLAAGVTAGFFGVLVFMLLRPIPAETHDVLLVMLGSLGTAWTAVIAYYFGSSAGSDKKTELMAKAASDKK
jgi:uncharacterized protein (DUF697 family)